MCTLCVSSSPCTVFDQPLIAWGRSGYVSNSPLPCCDFYNVQYLKTVNSEQNHSGCRLLMFSPGDCLNVIFKIFVSAINFKVRAQCEMKVCSFIGPTDSGLQSLCYRNSGFCSFVIPNVSVSTLAGECRALEEANNRTYIITLQQYVEITYCIMHVTCQFYSTTTA